MTKERKKRGRKPKNGKNVKKAPPKKRGRKPMGKEMGGGTQTYATNINNS